MSKSQKKPDIITIPCKRHLRKYLEALYNGPFHADKYTSLGHFILLCLSNKTYRYDKTPITRADLYGDQLSIKIGAWNFGKLGSEISLEKVVAINNYIEEVFTEHLYWWCELNKVSGRYKRYDYHIRLFARIHNIDIDGDDEDITYEALKKKRYRYAQTIQNRKRPLIGVAV